MSKPNQEMQPSAPPSTALTPPACSLEKTLRERVNSNDEWLANSQRLYLEENRRNGQYARKLRETRNLSCRELARRMGISAMMLSDMERGMRNWSQSMLTKWEQAMTSENTGAVKQ